MDDRKETLWTKLYRFKIHHVLFWLGYYAFWILFYKEYYHAIIQLVFNTTLYFVFNAAAFYVTAYYLFPRFLYKNYYASFFLYFAALILALSIGLASCLHFAFQGYDAAIANNITGLLQIAFLSIGTMAGGMCAVKLITDKIRADSTVRKMDQQRLESELQYLKAQVNPHFLFNAINSVYFLIKKNPDQAAETLIKLSDLLRFQLYDCSDDKIAIEKEIEYLTNFISLEKIRKGDKVKVEMVQEGNLTGFHIAPFLLIPFFENAFKYVSNYSQEQNCISIQLKRQDDLFIAAITNTTDNVKTNGVGGIGLKNVQRRLELLYPEKHDLQIQEEDGHYSVLLSLTIA
jgi:two-component system LytT family sensor kinase